MAKIFQLGDADKGHDELSITNYRSAGMCMTIEQPWAGDTETGFGQSSSFYLSEEQAKLLAEWLLEQVKET